MKIAVVGLGIVGLSVASRLQAEEHSVTGFEQFDLLHARGSSHGDTRIFRRYPFEGEVYVDLAARSYEGWRRWSDEAGQRLLVECGGFHAAPEDSRYIRNPAAFERQHGLTPQIISAADCNARWPVFNIPDAFAVILQPQNGFVLPDATRAFLANKARQAGAYLRDKCTADIDPDSGTVNGDRFDAIFVTAGPWIPALVPELQEHLTIERRVFAWYEPTVAFDPASIPTFRIGTEFYGMPTPDGSLKVGMNDHYHEQVAPDDVAEPQPRDQSLINSNAQQYLRQVAAQPKQMARCLYTMTPDHDFIVDRHPRHSSLFIMSCCSGHGFKYAPAYGDLAADLLEGRASPQFSLSRFRV